MHILNYYRYYIFIIIIKIVQLKIENCSEKNDCINCIFLIDCQWENNQCINISHTHIQKRAFNNNKSNNNMGNKIFELWNEATKYKNLKYLYNICYNKISPYTEEDDLVYEIASEKYCGKKNIIITKDMLINGFSIKLNNVNGVYGHPHIICQYLFLSGNIRHDVDIYINNSLKEDFFLFYTNDYKDSIQIKYTSNISLISANSNTVSFFYYSDKTFDTSPFIIFCRDYPRYSHSILQYYFLAGIIFLMIVIISGIIYIFYVRYISQIFNKIVYKEINANDKNNNKSNQRKKNENNNSMNYNNTNMLEERNKIGNYNSNNELEHVNKKDNF